MKNVVFLDDPWILDDTIDYIADRRYDGSPDSVLAYLPLYISKEKVLRRLDIIISKYGEANEENEADFSSDVGMLLKQIAVYDEFWKKKAKSKQKHSKEAVDLIVDFIAELEEIPDGCAECFPFEMIDMLKEEYNV